MKRVYIMSGLPGMGKSTIADVLATGHRCSGHSVEVLSADHHIVTEDGTYEWTPERLVEAHAKVRRRFVHLMMAKHSVPDVVILDNTNLAKKEFLAYKSLAEEEGWQVSEVCVGNLDIEVALKRNVHNCPRATLERMRDRLKFRWVG